MLPRLSVQSGILLWNCPLVSLLVFFSFSTALIVTCINPLTKIKKIIKKRNKLILKKPKRKKTNSKGRLCFSRPLSRWAFPRSRKRLGTDGPRVFRAIHFLAVTDSVASLHLELPSFLLEHLPYFLPPLLLFCSIFPYEEFWNVGKGGCVFCAVWVSSMNNINQFWKWAVASQSNTARIASYNFL